MSYGEGFQKTVMHEETDFCREVHCAFHHVDEFGGRTYRRCGECAHQYRSKRDLVRAYRAVLWSMVKDDLRRYRSIAWVLLWNLVSRRAEDIHFCQFCVHDF